MSEMLLPLQERRPDDLQAMIDAKYAKDSVILSGSYDFNGTHPNYVLNGVSTSVMIEALRERNPSLRVLDVGTGAGAFLENPLWQPEDTVHGITGYDYRRNPNVFTSPQLSDDIYKIGNVENFATISGLLPKYDFVITKYLMLHLLDPLGTLEQLANRVDAGGVLAIDQFGWFTEPESQEQAHQRVSLNSVLSALNSAGFATEDTSLEFIHDWTIPNFALQGINKTSVVLERMHADQPVQLPFEVQLDRKAFQPVALYSQAA